MTARRLVLITAGAAVALGGFLWWQNRARPLPAAVAPNQPAPEFLPNLGWLNFSLDDVLYPGGRPEPVPVLSRPIEMGDNMLQPKGIRNKNPLNIEYSAANNWLGQVGTDGRFIVFDTEFNGIRAAARLLKNYRDRHGLGTVRGIINRWAPPSENPTGKYVDYVAKNAGVAADAPLGVADYPRVVAAMIKFENGIQPYETSLINSATAAGFQ